MKRFLFILLIGTTAFANQDQILVGGGVGVFNSGKSGLSETKVLTLGVQEDLYGPLKQRANVGGWLDRVGNGRKSSALVSGQLGFEVQNGGWVGSVFSGPAIISNTDSYLGGHFQFMDDLHLGLQDRDGNYIGVMYRHLSSAGIEMPNVGRDFMCLELRFPF